MCLWTKLRWNKALQNSNRFQLWHSLLTTHPTCMREKSPCQLPIRSSSQRNSAQLLKGSSVVGASNWITMILILIRCSAPTAAKTMASATEWIALYPELSNNTNGEGDKMDSVSFCKSNLRIHPCVLELTKKPIWRSVRKITRTLNQAP